MANYTIFAQVSNLLRSTLWQQFTRSQRVQFGMSDEQSSIVFSSPADSVGASNRLSLWLYHIEEEAFMRNQELPIRHDSLIIGGPAPIKFDLYFLVTPLKSASTAPETDLALLGRTIEIFHAHPIFDGSTSPELGDGRLSLELLPISNEEMGQLWNSMNGVSRQLSVVFKVRGATLRGEGRPEMPVIRPEEIEN